MASELSSRAAQIAQADRIRRLLLADVCHELMTPLTAVRGFQEKLAADDAIRASAERARYVSIIGDETYRVEHIVGDLLDLARLESAGESLNVEDVSVEALFGRIAARHAADATDRGITLITEVERGAEIVYGDRFRLEQALQNLTANALRHTSSGGSVELRAASTDGQTMISVRDTGVGIAQTHLPFIFDRFYKVDPARTAPSPGSGLGLSIVRAIVERHGGTVSVTSTENVGTVFTIHLPSTIPALSLAR
jgi:two-component system sensor histidine kinase ResE